MSGPCEILEDLHWEESANEIIHMCVSSTQYGLADFRLLAKSEQCVAECTTLRLVYFQQIAPNKPVKGPRPAPPHWTGP